MKTVRNALTDLAALVATIGLNALWMITALALFLLILLAIPALWN